ncbi:low temperature requirement protein A [Plantactinospora sp. ZYX-F-223]|uniref:low temperature requirement protein A n=1 Tax=Plantactinospora sp. ZYX-F-223 TaxID=3144103 RepID=UPI0031FCEB9F
MAMRGEAGEPAPASARPDPTRPTYLELFFDLAYIFALIVVTEELLNDLSWGGTGRAVVLFLAFTLIWALATWAGDLLDLTRPTVVPQVVGVMAGSLLLAGTVPEAYQEGGLLFAVTYLAIHFGSGLYYTLVPSGAARTRTHRTMLWEAVAAVPWIIGGLQANAGTRATLWAVALAVEYLGVVLGWPTPWAWRRPPREPRRVGERVAERYRQFVIVALGASLFLVGSEFSEGRYTRDRAVALVVVFTTTVLIWRIYIYRAGQLMTGTIARAANPARLSEITAFVHLVMVAGIVGTSVASQLVIRQPFGDTPPALAAVILGGPALFLVGRALLDYTVFAHVNRARLVGLLLLAGLAAATPLLPPVMVGLTVVGVLAGIATSNLIQTLTNPPRPATR